MHLIDLLAKNVIFIETQKASIFCSRFAGKDQAGKINYEDFINRLMKLENESSSTALQNAEQTKPDLIDPVRKQKSNGNKERTGKKVVFGRPTIDLYNESRIVFSQAQTQKNVLEVGSKNKAIESFT